MSSRLPTLCGSFPQFFQIFHKIGWLTKAGGRDYNGSTLQEVEEVGTRFRVRPPLLEEKVWHITIRQFASTLQNENPKTGFFNWPVFWLIPVNQEKVQVLNPYSFLKFSFSG